MICPVCHKRFDPAADRAAPTAAAGSIEQIKYCSERCARSAENRRAYLKRLGRKKTVTK